MARTLAITAAVIAIWLAGAAVTKYSLGQMALLAPIAVLFVGAIAALAILWTKIVIESLRRRRGANGDDAAV